MQEEIDRLWTVHVGSSKLSSYDELRILKGLRGKLRNSDLYNLYLRSKYWRAIRWKVMKRDEMRCVKCGRQQDLQVNHKRYGEYGEEKLEDLETLCRMCHVSVTKKYDLMMNKVVRKVNVEDGKLHLMMRRKYG